MQILLLSCPAVDNLLRTNSGLAPEGGFIPEAVHYSDTNHAPQLSRIYLPTQPDSRSLMHLWAQSGTTAMLALPWPAWPSGDCLLMGVPDTTTHVTILNAQAYGSQLGNSQHACSALSAYLAVCVWALVTWAGQTLLAQQPALLYGSIAVLGYPLLPWQPGEAFVPESSIPGFRRCIDVAWGLPVHVCGLLTFVQHCLDHMQHQMT